MSRANSLLVLLEEYGPVRTRQTKHAGSWSARCPAHKDKDPSLVVTELHDGRVLLKCFAGCGAADVLRALGKVTIGGDADWSVLFPDERINKNHVERSVFGPRPRIRRTVDDHVLAIAEADRRNGKRLSEAEKRLEFEAYKRVRGRGV